MRFKIIKKANAIEKAIQVKKAHEKKKEADMKRQAERDKAANKMKVENLLLFDNDWGGGRHRCSQESCRQFKEEELDSKMKIENLLLDEFKGLYLKQMQHIKERDKMKIENILLDEPVVEIRHTVKEVESMSDWEVFQMGQGFMVCLAVHSLAIGLVVEPNLLIVVFREQNIVEPRSPTFEAWQRNRSLLLQLKTGGWGDDIIDKTIREGDIVNGIGPEMLKLTEEEDILEAIIPMKEESCPELSEMESFRAKSHRITAQEVKRAEKKICGRKDNKAHTEVKRREQKIRKNHKALSPYWTVVV
ncbi:MAG: hypothetical protein Q9222_002400 [Ikaeria aurantiellina]